MPKIIETSTDTIGGRIRWARETAGLTQEELAKQAQYKQGGLSDLERDGVEPRLSTIRKLAVVLGVLPGWLAFGEGAPSIDSVGLSAPGAILSPPVAEAP